MSLLMKALQQAAQNRSARPATGDDGGQAPAPGSDPAADAPAAGASGPAQADGAGRESSLEQLGLVPIPDRPDPAPLPGPEVGVAATGIPDADPPRARSAPRTAPPLRADPAAASAANGRAARPPGGGPADRRSAPRWSGDLQDDARASDSDLPDPAAGDARSGELARRRGQRRERADASPARAGAVLAAGAGAARAGALSRVTRMQWIIAGGLLSGALLFLYFYIQISHPGLLQRGVRQPALVSPVAGRPPPPAPAGAVTAAGVIDSGANVPTPVPGPAPAVGTVPSGPDRPPPSDATTRSEAPTTQAAQAGAGAGPAAAAIGSAPPRAALPMTGVPPTQSVPSSSPASAAPPAPGVPAALAASPLLNPPPASADAAASAGPATATAAPAASTPAQAAAPAVPARPSPALAPPRATGPQPRTPSPTPADQGIRVTRGSTTNPVNPALADAYDHLQAGRIESAQRLYEQVAHADPRNVDALLGMGAVAQLGNQADVATRLYLRVLEIEPRNAHAQAALIGQLGRADPVAAESQLKTLIGREPSPFLYFTLGNLYADQNRWAQAQQAWFQAHHLQPGNADYAFNLAIGLERIAQPRLAIDYLRTAIRLAESGARANFDVAAARKRVALLESAQPKAP